MVREGEKRKRTKGGVGERGRRAIREEKGEPALPRLPPLSLRRRRAVPLNI